MKKATLNQQKPSLRTDKADLENAVLARLSRVQSAHWQSCLGLASFWAFY